MEEAEKLEEPKRLKPNRLKASDIKESLAADHEMSDEADQETMDLENMDEESRQAYLLEQMKAVKAREEDAKMMKEYEERMEKETLKTFKDAPDEVKSVFV